MLFSYCFLVTCFSASQDGISWSSVHLWRVCNIHNSEQISHGPRGVPCCQAGGTGGRLQVKELLSFSRAGGGGVLLAMWGLLLLFYFGISLTRFHHVHVRSNAESLAFYG